ncbi:MAG: hypothetical protein HYS25_06575 [Ignavibacteriales bacterium]|nr:hypothetical protein [Ignavibacteriales bacterium]
MKKTKSSSIVAEMQTEYKFDYKKAKPNRFADLEKQIVVQIDKDVAEVFDSSEKVNSALRAIISAYPKSRKKRQKV